MYTSIRLGKPRMNCFLFPKAYNMRVGTLWYNPWLTPMAQGFPWEEKWRDVLFCFSLFFPVNLKQVGLCPKCPLQKGDLYDWVFFCFPTGTNLKSESLLTSDYREKNHLLFEVACGHLTPMISRNSMELMGNPRRNQFDTSLGLDPMLYGLGSVWRVGIDATNGFLKRYCNWPRLKKKKVPILEVSKNRNVVHFRFFFLISALMHCLGSVV